LRPADEAKQWYAAFFEAGQHIIERRGMRWRQHNGIGSFVYRALKQSALLFDSVGLLGQ
jgi:hypothetical protein